MQSVRSNQGYRTSCKSEISETEVTDHMTMYDRRHSNPGKREREAGKRHRRGTTSYREAGAAEWTTLRLGRKHLLRNFRLRALRRVMTVAESEKRANGAPESP